MKVFGRQACHGLAGHMVRANKLLIDIKKNSTILHTLHLFDLNIGIDVHEDHQENLIHQGIVDLECITLLTETESI